MRHINVYVSMGLSGCRIEEDIEVEDDATEEEIESQVSEWALDKVEWWHEEADAAHLEEKGE